MSLLGIKLKKNYSFILIILLMIQEFKFIPSLFLIQALIKINSFSKNKSFDKRMGNMRMKYLIFLLLVSQGNLYFYVLFLIVLFVFKLRYHF